MTAVRVELRRLVSAALMLSVDVGRMGGDGTARDRVSRYVRRKTHFFGDMYIVQESGFKTRKRRCGTTCNFLLILGVIYSRGEMRS